VLERARIAESWRSRSDSFTLVTPNWMTRLPGHALAPGSGREFIPRRDVVGMLEGLADGLPVREGEDVTSVTAGDGGYQVATSAAAQRGARVPGGLAWAPGGFRGAPGS
jgi:putative flavoprotein involved in K+ transport